MSCSDLDSRARTGRGAYPRGGIMVTTFVGYSELTRVETN